MRNLQYLNKRVVKNLLMHFCILFTCKTNLVSRLLAHVLLICTSVQDIDQEVLVTYQTVNHKCICINGFETASDNPEGKYKNNEDRGYSDTGGSVNRNNSSGSELRLISFSPNVFNGTYLVIRFV